MGTVTGASERGQWYLGSNYHSGFLLEYTTAPRGIAYTRDAVACTGYEIRAFKVTQVDSLGLEESETLL